MKRKSLRTSKLYSIILIFVCVLLPLFSFLLSIFPQMTFAENTVYSNVLEDLQKDETFNVDKYPLIENEYSLQVIQIAESEDNELFIYVYQPSGEIQNLKATTISISNAETGIDPFLYSLTFLNSHNVFFKYKVNDFKVSNQETRYYKIIEIFRNFDEKIDEKNDDNLINEVSYSVGQFWTATTKNEETKYNCSLIETITITDKYVGFLRYQTDYAGTSFDNHFVAFSTDKPIERLLSAKVYYSIQPCHLESIHGENNSFGNVKGNEYVSLSYKDKSSVTINNGWFKQWTYEWDKIQKVEDFLIEEDRSTIYDVGIFNVTHQSQITEESVKKIENKQWVLRFVDTEYNVKFVQGGMLTNKITDFSIIGDVSIIELNFETNGIVYDLGVVDNKQTGSDKPDNEENTNIKLTNWFKWFLIILGLVLIVCFLFPVLLPLVPIILNCLVWLIKGLAKVCWYVLKGFWWVITAPLSIFSD